MNDILSSKKFWATVAGAAAVALGEAQAAGLSPRAGYLIAALAAVFVVAQGIADHGKEAEKVRLRDHDLLWETRARKKLAMPAGTYWDGASYVEPGDPDWSIKNLEKVVEVPK